MAATALAAGDRLLGGAAATVQAAGRGAARRPYDAPAWIPTDRPVRFGELVDAAAVAGRRLRAGHVPRAVQHRTRSVHVAAPAVSDAVALPCAAGPDRRCRRLASRCCGERAVSAQLLPGPARAELGVAASHDRDGPGHPGPWRGHSALCRVRQERAAAFVRCAAAASRGLRGDSRRHPHVDRSGFHDRSFQRVSLHAAAQSGVPGELRISVHAHGRSVGNGRGAAGAAGPIGTRRLSGTDGHDWNADRLPRAARRRGAAGRPRSGCRPRFDPDRHIGASGARRRSAARRAGASGGRTARGDIVAAAGDDSPLVRRPHDRGARAAGDEPCRQPGRGHRHAARHGLAAAMRGVHWCRSWRRRRRGLSG